MRWLRKQTAVVARVVQRLGRRKIVSGVCCYRCRTWSLPILLLLRNKNETYHRPRAYIPSCDSASSFLLRGWDLRGDGRSRGQKGRRRRRSVDDDGVGGGSDRVERLLCLLDYIMNAWSDTTNRASDATAADDDHGKTDFFQSIWNMRETTTTNTTAKSMKGAIPTPTPPNLRGRNNHRIPPLLLQRLVLVLPPTAAPNAPAAISARTARKAVLRFLEWTTRASVSLGRMSAGHGEDDILSPS